MTDVITGTGCHISEDAAVGPSGSRRGGPAVIGDDATVRSGTILYPDVEVGDRFRSGHHVVVGAGTTAGDDVLLGTRTVVEHDATVGSHVGLQAGTYLAPNASVGDRVFLGPGAILTGGAVPGRENATQVTTLRDGVSDGANATLLPGVTVGEDSFVASGAVVTADVPPETLAAGMPAEHRPLQDCLREGFRPD
jgi:acetyltransferase-like isoleucine patch superfamily enzyme